MVVTSKSITNLQGIQMSEKAYQITHVQLNTGPEWVAVEDLQCWRCGKIPAVHIVLVEGKTEEQSSGMAFCSPGCEEAYTVLEAPDGASESTHYEGLPV